jgi:hypothetical protein
MYELAMVVDFAREVGVVLFRRFEHDLSGISDCSFPAIVGPLRTLEPLLSLCDAK